MKCTIPEISWHNRDPVLSVDVQCGKEEDFYRLASGGTDSHVVVWHVRVKDNGMAEVNFVADLQRHQRAVNTVRFSPSGEFLASGDDESAIIVWKQKTEQDAPELPSNVVETSPQQEQWLHVKILRGHVEDVYDLCWSPDSTCLVSGSVDNTAILWDVHKGRHTAILSDHKGFVQGVAWDPKNRYVATLSSDRTCRVFNVQTKKVVCRASKAPLPVAEGSDSELDGKPLRLFYDDTLKSFFRRLCFSPDGELLFAPSGIIESPDANKHGNATHVFMRRMFNRPVMYLPSPDQYTIAVRCCPMLFKLHDGDSMFALPYRMVVAVATQSSVVLYDTQQPEPFGIISNIHYTRLTDLAWSSDGRTLVVASTDGYCSIVTFSKGELGEEYVPVKPSAVSTAPSNAADNQVIDKQCPGENKVAVSGPGEVDANRLCPAESNAGSSVKKSHVTSASVETGISEANQGTCPLDSDNGKLITQVLEVGETIVKKKPIRRIQPVMITAKSSPRKVKDGTSSDSSVLKASPSKSISAYFNKPKNIEAEIDSVSPCESNSVKVDRVNECGVMDVDGDNIVESTASSHLDPQSDEGIKTLSNKVTCEKSSAEISTLPVERKTTTGSEHIDSPTKIISCKEGPSDISVADSIALSVSKSGDSVAAGSETSQQKIQCAESETVLSDKPACNNIEKMDVDEVVEEVSGTSNVLPDKAEVLEESHVSEKLCAESHCQNQAALEDSEGINVASESNQNPSVSEVPCTTDLGISTEERPTSEQVLRTPTKSAGADCKSSPGSVATPGSPARGDAEAPTISPAPQAKKTPRRVQLITLSSPKSKRNLLQS